MRHYLNMNKHSHYSLLKLNRMRWRTGQHYSVVSGTAAPFRPPIPCTVHLVRYAPLCYVPSAVATVLLPSVGGMGGALLSAVHCPHFYFWKIFIFMPTVRTVLVRQLVRNVQTKRIVF